MTLWLYVTADELELPMIVADSANELADKLGVTPSNIYSAIWKAEKHGGKSRYKKVLLPTSEE